VSDTLFDDDGLRVEPAENMSTDARRTVRQRRLIDAGLHPLMVTAGYSPSQARLHPNAAPEICSPDAPKGAPYTCGSCRFRQVLRWHDRTYPKCIQEVEGTNLLTAPSITHGAATDCRAWWPACRLYEPGDPGLSPDAMRVIP
jgi:hypothetical protein